MMEEIIEITTCEVCGNDELVSVLDLGEHPLCDDLISVEDRSQSICYPISILFCDRCRTAHQRYQIPKTRLFPETYHYRSRLTADVLFGMEDLVNSVERQLGSLENKVVLDIGCNDGSLLDRFSEKGALTLGVEPTSAYADADLNTHKIVNDYFSLSVASDLLNAYGTVDVVTFTNVFAHIENLPELLSALSILLHSRTKIIVENHYLGSVLKNSQFDTFYHEHPRTYSLTSFEYIAKSLRGHISAVEFPSRYGGNIRVTITADLSSLENPVLANIKRKTEEYELTFIEEFKVLKHFIDDWKVAKKLELETLIRERGPIVAKAFPGRAAILIKCLGLDESQIACVYEKPDSPKNGHFVPGTRIPIKSDSDLALLNPDIILNLAWHISDEIHNYLRSIGCTGRVINIMELASEEHI